MDREKLKQRRLRREAFLMTLYEDVDGSVTQFVDGHEIAARVGAEPEEARRIIAYFEEKGLILVDDYKTGIVRITVEGVDEVEKDPA